MFQRKDPHTAHKDGPIIDGVHTTTYVLWLVLSTTIHWYSSGLLHSPLVETLY